MLHFYLLFYVAGLLHISHMRVYTAALTKDLTVVTEEGNFTLTSQIPTPLFLVQLRSSKGIQIHLKFLVERTIP